MKRPLWAVWLDAAKSRVTTPQEALRRTEAGLTDENDCSTFVLTITGGPDPVSVTVTPDEMRRTLRGLAS